MKLVPFGEGYLVNKDEIIWVCLGKKNCSQEIFYVNCYLRNGDSVVSKDFYDRKEAQAFLTDFYRQCEDGE